MRRRGVRDFKGRFEVVNPGQIEIITQTLWFRLNYVSATTTELVFFTAVADGPILGNMVQAGQLQSGQSFLIRAIRVAIQADTRETATAASAGGVTETAYEDVKELAYDGTLALTIMDKPYGVWPIWMLPAGGGPTVVIATSGTHAAGSHSMISGAVNGSPDPRAVYSLTRPIRIPPQVAFRATLRWDAAKTLNVGNTAITVCLDGDLRRPSQ